MELQGTIKVIGETQTFGSNGFRKREVVVTTDEQYPQTIMTEFVQDKCDILNSYNVGDKVSIGINLRGREWVNPEGETKYFNSIQGWKISRVEGSSQGTTPPPPEGDFEMADESDLNDEDFDDLPF